MRLIASLLSFLLVVMPASVAAQPPTTTAAPEAAQFQLPDPGDLVPVRQGQVATATGLIIAAPDMLNIQQEYERMRFMLGLTHDRDTQLCDIRVQAEQARTSAAEERVTLHDTLWTQRQQELVAAIAAAQAQAQHAAERQWFESPPLWAAIGVVLATIVYVAISVR